MDIKALRSFTGKKVVVLGKGGLGKSSTINLLTKSKSDFAVGTGSDDVTKNVQYFVDSQKNVCYIDTPGMNHNIQKWYKEMLEIGQVHGVLIFVRPEERNTDYADLQYIITYLKESGHYFQICRRTKDAAAEDTDNLAFDAVALGKGEVGPLEKWVRDIPADASFIIHSPLGLISVCNSLQHQLATANTENANLRLQLVGKQKELDNERALAAIAVKVHESRRKKCTALVGALSARDSRGKLTARAPSRWHYGYSLLPGAGAAWLSECRSQFKRTRAMAVQFQEELATDSGAEPPRPPAQV